MDARQFIDAGAIPLYGLLPSMAGLNEQLLQQALEDMIQYYQSRDDEEHLRDELLCFQALFRRARPLATAQMESVLRRIRMFDSLLDDDPWVQERVALGKTRGKAQASRQYIPLIVQARFPDLVSLANECIAQIQESDTLGQVLLTLSTLSNEDEARSYLSSLREKK